MDSTFICSSTELLPVSIVDTPSIMMLLLLPPVDDRSPTREGLVPVTPGASVASCTKLRLEIGRLSTALVVTANDRSPLCVWTSGDSACTVTASARPPTSTVSTPRPTRSPALTEMPLRLSVLKPSIETWMDGFKTLKRSGISVSAGDRVGLGVLTVEVGGLAEAVTVQAESPLVQTQSGERSFAVTTKAVESLPISNRSFVQLATLAP